MSATVLRPPRLWKYLLVSALILLLLIPAWTLLLQLAIQPGPLMNSELSMTNRLLWWVGIPVVAVLAAAGSQWSVASTNAERQQATPSTAALSGSQSAAAKEPARSEYVLEIISMGATLDKYRQGALWDVLAKGNAYASIRDSNPKNYPWTQNDKGGITGGRVGSTLENAIKPMPKYWVAPTFFAGPPLSKTSYVPSETKPFDPMTSSGSTRFSGLSFNMFVPAAWALAERPDRLLERAFTFFDENPDLPYLVVSSADDVYTRDSYSAPGTPRLVRDGYYVTEMPDTSAMFVLARRERVDAIRPFTFEDIDEDKVDMNTLNSQGVARRVFLAFFNLEGSFPKEKNSGGRSATVAEWLKTAAAFSKRSDIYDNSISLRHPFGRKGPSKDFKPTPWFPVPWNQIQLDGFDALPTLGYLHRPVYVSMIDKYGKPLTRTDERTAALATGWQQALQTLPEAERHATPARVVIATGGNTDQTVAITSVLADWSTKGGPTLDKAKAAQWISTDARLGNTGAATWFMEMAIGVLGSYRDGGTSAAINLRDTGEASIVFISPPPEGKRQHYQNLFTDRTTPAIDPKNYEQH